MAQTTTSAPQQGVNMPAVDLRQMIGALVAVEGVRTSTDLLVSQRGAGANMSVDIAAGSCLITDDHASGGGVYGFTLGSTTNVAVGTASGTNPRIDRVVVTVLDNALGDASNSAAPAVLAGTPTSGATLTNLSGAAAVPSSALLLANVLVPTSATSVVTANIANVATIVKAASSTSSVLYDSGFLSVGQAAIDSGTMTVPSWVNHLRTRVYGRSATAAVNDVLNIQVNGDTATNYEWSIWNGTSSTLAAQFQASPTWPAATTALNIPGAVTIHMPFACVGSTFQRSMRSITETGESGDAFGAASADYHGTWKSTTAVSRVRAFHGSGANFIAGSRMIVYGDA